MKKQTNSNKSKITIELTEAELKQIAVLIESDTNFLNETERKNLIEKILPILIKNQNQFQKDMLKTQEFLKNIKTNETKKTT